MTIRKSKDSKIITRACISDSGVLNRNILIQKRIGTDSVYGRVYLSCAPYNGKCDSPLAVKKIVSKEVNRYRKFPFKKKTLDKSSVYTEILICKLVDFLHTKRLSPCLPNFFKYNVCYKTSTTTIVTELAKGDLKNLITEITPSVETMSFIYFEIFAALYVIKTFFNIEHDDLHWGNVLFRETKKDFSKYRKYIIRNTEFFVPLTGITPVLWDFGLSYIPGKIRQKSDIDEDTHRGIYEDYSRILTMLIDDNKKPQIKNIYDNLAMSLYNTMTEYIINNKDPVEFVMFLGETLNDILAKTIKKPLESSVAEVYRCDKKVNTNDSMVLRFINKKQLINN
jgi:hypothetical protein